MPIGMQTMPLDSLHNRVLVTESLPIWINGEGEKSFSFADAGKQKSETADPFRLSVEYSSNPVWYAVQSLPYLVEYPHECSEQVFSRLYANAISTKLVRDNPGIEQVIKIWEGSQPDALQSNLFKNESLKAIAIRESPTP